MLKPERGSWPDFEGKLDGQRVGVELAEIVDPAEARNRSVRDEYLTQILENIDDLLPRFVGLWIMLNDGFQDAQEWPPLGSRNGKALAAIISKGLHDLADELEALDDKVMIRSWSDDPKAGLSAHRVAPRDKGTPAEVSFPQGVYFGYPGKGTELLATTILSKVSKRYTTFDGHLWLLLYETEATWAGFERDEAFKAAHLDLEKAAHPFDEVWYFHPYAGEDMGSLHRIWPGGEQRLHS